MASLRAIVIPAGSKRLQTIASRSVSRIGGHAINGRRWLHRDNSSDPSPPHKQHTIHNSSTSHLLKPRHDVHERTEALTVPGVNPPGGGGGPGPGGSSVFEITRSPMVDAMLTTFIGIGLMFAGGIVYLEWYKSNVLSKIENAFEAGYDPALELVKRRVIKRPSPDEYEDSVGLWTEKLRRKEQDLIDEIVHGNEAGHYFMLLGPKGSGKGSMVFEAMLSCNAEGISVCDAHPDLEVFRLRLGKALNFEFHEDSQTGLFQRRDPREGGPGLDIERALNKLEKVALRVAQEKGKPLVFIVNNIHYFKNDDNGRGMLLQLQQRAEAWAASGVLTMVFTSDDFWPFQFMRRTASRMHTVSIYDLDRAESIKAIYQLRQSDSRKPFTPEIAEELVDLVGGRLSYLSKVCRTTTMTPLNLAKHLLEVEKEWLLSQIGLIDDCDDDVMDEQKWSSCSWLLLREFVKIRNEQERQRAEDIAAGKTDLEDLPLPTISYGDCRQIMTRADFMEELDRLNVISIDINHDVRPDSMLILHAAREVCEGEGFDDLLDSVRGRIDDIESLHRTRELTFKDVDKGDMIRLAVDKGGYEYFSTRGKSSHFDDDDDDDDD